MSLVDRGLQIFRQYIVERVLLLDSNNDQNVYDEFRICHFIILESEASKRKYEVNELNAKLAFAV
jgi:hypothetical protein